MNAYGELGNATTTNAAAAVPVAGIDTATAITAVNSHHSHDPLVVVTASKAIVVISATPGRKSSAKAPARLGQEA